MLGLVLLVEREVASYHRHLTTTTALNWGYVKKASESEAARSRILCLGSSLVELGVVPRVIEATTGKSTFNLAVCGGATPVSYFSLRRALEAGARPDAILMDCSEGRSKRWSRAEQAEWLFQNKRHWPELLDLLDTIDLAWVSLNGDFLVTTLASRVVPSYKARFEIRSAILAGCRGEGEPSRRVLDLFRRNWWSNRGAFVVPRNPNFETKHRSESVQTPPQIVVHNGYRTNPIKTTYARRFFDLAAAQGIRVFWLVPPISAGRQQIKNETGEDQEQTLFIRQTQAKYPNVVVIDGRRLGYSIEAFADETHLAAPGAAAFSSEVAAVVRRVLDTQATGQLWVTLRARGDVDLRPDPRLEDLHQSAIALTNGPVRR
jgi:hypothetical protein